MFIKDEIYYGSYSDYDAITRGYSYQVVKRTDKTIWLQKVSRFYDGGGDQVGTTTANNEPILRKKLKQSIDRDGNSYESVWLNYFSLYSN